MHVCEANACLRPPERLLKTNGDWVFEVPAPGVPDFKQWIKNEMEAVYELAVPLVVDVGAGATWGAAH